MTFETYIAGLENNEKQIKKDLDPLIEKHKRQHVGDGYIDIIFSACRCMDFAAELTKPGIAIRSGFSEKGWHYDDIYPRENSDADDNNPAKKMNSETIRLITNKRSESADGHYQIFGEDKCLTPPLWLLVPDEWKNK